MRVFVELGPTMRALLAPLARQDGSVRRLLAAFPVAAPAVVHNGGSQLMATDMLPSAPPVACAGP